MEAEKTLDQNNPQRVSSDLVDDKNRNEWDRLQSFSSFPSSIDISFLLLAQAGFYYTGIHTECRCFSCGKVYKKWKDGDNPYIMHRKISPECFYMNGRESGNVPVDETDGDRPKPFTYVTSSTTVSDAGQEEIVGVPDSGRRKVVKLGNIELEEKTESKGDKRESQDERRQYDEDTSNGRRQYDEDTSNDRRQHDEDTSNDRRQHDEDTSNDRRQHDEDTSNGRRQHDEDTSNDRRQYDEDTSSSATDGIDEPNTNEAERLTGQNGDDNSSNVLGISTQRNADTSGMVDNQIDHQNRTTCTTDDCTLPNNVPTATDSNNCLHSYALTDETSKETEIERFGYTIPKSNINDEHNSKVHYSTSIIQTQLDLLIRKYFETIDYKGLATVYKHLFCIDNLCQTLYVYPVLEVQGELNDTPRAIPIHHPGDTTYLSASGNQVCHPEEEQVSNRHTIHNEVQPNNALAEARQFNVNVSDNRMLNDSVSDDRIESRGGEEQTTHVSTGNPGDLYDGPSPITGIHGTWHRNSFEDLPILMANGHGTSGYQLTCPLDAGLMILFYQMKKNPCIHHIFIGSSHSIFNRELVSIFHLFMNRKYEELRGTWAKIIEWSSNSFHGCEGEVMMIPFFHLIEFKYSFECSNVTCLLDRRKFCMSGMRLRCPEQRSLDSSKLQQLIDDFTCDIINPCFYSDSCSGTRTIHRIVQTSPEQPPMVVLNMVRSRLTRGQIGNFIYTVRIGDIDYYIGGITFAGNEHYTAIIILHQQYKLLFYDNLHGIKVIDTIHQERASDILSLIYLFRKR